jgi:type VI secretion system secreted protein Hcp
MPSNIEMHLSLNSRQAGLIQGESQSVLHPDEIEISSFQWSASTPTTRSADGSFKGGRATVSELTFTKHLDRATSQLFLHLVNNLIIKTAKFSISKSTGGSKPEDFFTIELTKVFVSSIRMSRVSEDVEKAEETITLSFDEVNMNYMMQGKDGLLKHGGSAPYKLTTGSS